jgi:probable rRNA maturation factor
MSALKLRLDVQNAASDGDIPTQTLLKRWVRAAIGTQRRSAEVSLRIVDEDEMCALNGRYRGKPQPTNVLSFPADLPPEVDLPHLGDIVICAAVVVREARAQHKLALDHWAHLVIHGTLHLLGFDHIDTADAEVMEGLEIEILNTLQIANPYLENGFNNHG